MNQSGRTSWIGLTRPPILLAKASDSFLSLKMSRLSKYFFPSATASFIDVTVHYFNDIHGDHLLFSFHYTNYSTQYKKNA
ncbi:TPA: hypothetical protein IX015_001437 [Enterococcus faecium]|nr:hypothetical protein [Enterococcus faecium]HAQ5554607.1 hypothetical protein [Enterococcus faecium]HAQ5732886.1 hypothetical protein [Enterococcus faecium]HBM6875938.1 hypothetical protein [Enterococcus faecium]HDA6179107.1 hypothetical protein [Enterococcus faecium]